MHDDDHLDFVSLLGSELVHQGILVSQIGNRHIRLKSLRCYKSPRNMVTLHEDEEGW